MTEKNENENKNSSNDSSLSNVLIIATSIWFKKMNCEMSEKFKEYLFWCPFLQPLPGKGLEGQGLNETYVKVERPFRVGMYVCALKVA